jgi:hypothetical protein
VPRHALEAEHAARADAGRVLRPAKPVVGHAPKPVWCCARPRQAERALCVQADLGFGLEAV